MDTLCQFGYNLVEVLLGFDADKVFTNILTTVVISELAQGVRSAHSHQD